MQLNIGSARSGGYGDCCPPVVDPYTFIALIAGITIHNHNTVLTNLGTARSGGGDCCPPVVDPYTFLALIAGRDGGKWRKKNISTLSNWMSCMNLLEKHGASQNHMH